MEVTIKSLRNRVAVHLGLDAPSYTDPSSCIPLALADLMLTEEGKAREASIEIQAWKHSSSDERGPVGEASSVRRARREVKLRLLTTPPRAAPHALEMAKHRDLASGTYLHR